MSLFHNRTQKFQVEYLHHIYLHHRRGAWLRSGGSIFMGFFALPAYQFELLPKNTLIGTIAAVIFLCLMNPPLLFMLKHSQSLIFSNIVSFFIHLFEIIGYTTVIYFFGGFKALWLSPIYAVVINYIGIIGPWWRSYMVATLCWVALSSAVALEFFGFIPCQYPTKFLSLDGKNQAAIIAAIAVILYIMAFASSVLGKLLRERKRQLQTANQKLAQNSEKLKKAETDLRKSNDALENRVKERTSQLVETNKDLEMEIIERKRVETALRTSEERYRAFFEDSPIEIMVVDKTARITGFNRTKKTSGGRFPCIGDVMYKDYAAGHTKNMYEELIDCIHNKKPMVFEDMAYHDKFLDIRMSPLEEGAMITMIDQTEKRRLEDQLHQIQKMEVIGVIAGGIAHDLNNILSGIVSYPDLILLNLEKNDPLRKQIEAIKKSGIRAAEVVADLMTIAKGVAYRRDILKLNDIIEEYLESFEHKALVEMYSSIRFQTQFDPDLFNIKGSAVHIKKILMNLVANACEAVEGDGNIMISSCNRYLEAPLKGYKEVIAGEYAQLIVSDDGVGISPKNLKRIFEPFYTKKVMGRSGTGLGLPVVWNTIHDHNGYIIVSSTKEGTRFELYFPAVRDEAITEKTEFDMESYLGNGERILVVDDEQAQRTIACELLNKLGYHSDAVPSGTDAILYVKRQPVDILLLDMVMPKGLNGRETYEKIIKIHPGQKAIIASGFAFTEEMKKAQSAGAGAYIKKPYTLQNLAIVLKNELAS